QPAYLHEYEHLTLARLVIARGVRTELGGVSALLDRLHAAAAGSGRVGSVREIRMLQALTHDAMGDIPLALLALGQSFATDAQPDDHVRLYLDEAGGMQGLLRCSLDSPDAGEDLRDQAHRLLDRARGPRPPPNPARSLVDPLSRREQ